MTSAFRFACLLLLVLCLPAQGRAAAYDELLHAVRFDDARAVQSLLQQGMDVNSVEEKRGESLLMIAVREKSMNVVDVLLRHPDLKPDARAVNGDTALMIASFGGNADAVKKLLDAGAQLNQPGWTALHYAAMHGDVQIVAMLLEHSAYIDAESPNKSTPLMLAAYAGKIYVVKLLLDEGADLMLKNDLGMNALDFARQAEHPDVVEGLEYRMSLLKK